MHPYAHATSSAAIHGGVATEYFPFHAWFDASKMEFCFYTHRALRHHLEGADAAIVKFGATLTTRSGVIVATRDLAMQHLDEDCTRRPRATDWLKEMQAPHWLPETYDPPATSAEIEAKRLNIVPEDVMPLYAWFDTTASWHDDSRHLAMRHHSFGIFEAEETFGPVIETGNGKVIPTRYLAERYVKCVVGRVPSAVDWLRHIVGHPWMAKQSIPPTLPAWSEFVA